MLSCTTKSGRGEAKSMQFLANKRILLGVTGSIAAYKSADLVRRLRESGAVVRVAMTENAKRFITPLTMQAVSGFPVHEDLFDLQAEAAMGHIELARWADVVLVAPASADFMARLAQGEANDLLTTLCLATHAPIALAPAMNQGMWQHALTQENRESLLQKGVHLFGPDEGSQACGEVGPGRMMQPLDIIEKLNTLFSTGALAGQRVLITAGPTHEAIDPVRFISNGSSGKMGYALAEAALEAGATVTLISGPVSLPAPDHIKTLSVVSAEDMYDSVMRNIAECDIFLAVAAVGDYRCDTISEQKIHKNAEALQLNLRRNPDIVASVGQLLSKPFIVGFAAETEQLVPQAIAKREQKNMDMIIANRVDVGLGMGSDENEVIVIGANTQTHLPPMTKPKLARELISMMADEFKKRKP
jgi:phosphopantothenoylcysteine decarboxylase / phosphopantothenate---cysteine ligase